jgi:hypothetical protein
MRDAVEKLLSLDATLGSLQSVAGLDELRSQYRTLRACGVIETPIAFFEGPPSTGTGGIRSERIAECRAQLAEALRMLGHGA